MSEAVLTFREWKQKVQSPSFKIYMCWTFCKFYIVFFIVPVSIYNQLVQASKKAKEFATDKIFVQDNWNCMQESHNFGLGANIGVKSDFT